MLSLEAIHVSFLEKKDEFLEKKDENMLMVLADVASLVTYLTRQFGFSFFPRRTQKFRRIFSKTK